MRRFLSLCVLLLAFPGVRPLRYADLNRSTRALLAEMEVTAERFDAVLSDIHRSTEERLRDGEYDHLVFYLLQSRAFTGQAPIEPALSARDFVRGLDEPERTRYLAGEGAAAALPANVLR